MAPVKVVIIRHPEFNFYLSSLFILLPIHDPTLIFVFSLKIVLLASLRIGLNFISHKSLLKINSEHDISFGP